MRKILLILFMIPLLANAQKYYSSSELTVGWKYWSSETSWDYLINNGDKVTLSCLPQIQSSGINLAMPTEICATYLLNNKFIVLTFSESDGIRLRSQRETVKLENLNYALSHVSSQLWYDIDFEHIVYDGNFNRIMIPCGIDYNGNHNAICIDFIESSANVKRIDSDAEFDEDNVKYFDMQGTEVSIDDVHKGQAFIKTDGKNSRKYVK